MKLATLAVAFALAMTGSAVQFPQANMIEGNAPPQLWPTKGLGELETLINAARQADKYLFIWDKQGGVGTSM